MIDEQVQHILKELEKITSLLVTQNEILTGKWVDIDDIFEKITILKHEKFINSNKLEAINKAVDSVRRQREIKERK